MLRQKLNPFTKQSNLAKTKIEQRLDALETENKDLKKDIEVFTESIIVTAKSLEEIAFIQNKHLNETETLILALAELNSIVNPKNDLLKYDLLNEPHN